jgi:hypothetical protein
MDSKQLEIACPCCATRLLIDVRTGTLLRSRRPEETDDTGKPKVGEKDWSEALGKVEKRSAEAPSKLDAALAREREKTARFDELFRQAEDKAKKRDHE